MFIFLIILSSSIIYLKILRAIKKLGFSLLKPIKIFLEPIFYVYLSGLEEQWP